MKSNILSRQELYELVWSEPLTSIAKMYKVTDHFIRPRCKKMLIPLPGSGYWARIKYGYKVEKEKLPINYSGKEMVTFSLDVPTNPLLAKQKEIMNDKRLNLVVHHNLTDPDPLVAQARDSLNRKDRYYHHGSIIFTESGKLDIHVGKENVGRALRIMDTLIKAIQVLGHSVKCRYNESFFVVYGEEIEIKLRELCKRIPDPKSSWGSNLVSTGILYFRMEGSWKTAEWRDGKQPLEDQISRILAKVLLVGEQLHYERLERQKREEERKEEERKRREYIALQDRELLEFKELFEKSKRRYHAEMIRDFVDIMEQRAIGNHSLTNELSEWIQWARKKADWYDPFIESDDELLRGVDRTNSTILNRK